MAEDSVVTYQALYRRFRPQRFADVLGQEHVTRALLAAVKDERVAHAYLFSGPRGTGKTSTARILAMALNCEKSLDGEPDGTCESCVAIRQGASMDVQELDAASNRKIDDIRDLMSRVALGTPGRWKIYIIDEVHQLTNDASTALLKTLEEPPAHVIFVLATTDPQKVLQTIRSRTQHFEFRLLGSDVLGSLLHEVAQKADLDLPDEVIDRVVGRGHGSARDALSALDQVAAAGGLEEDTATAADIVGAIAERDPGKVLTLVADAAQAGLDPRSLATDMLRYLRDGFLTTRARSLVLLADDAATEARTVAEQLGPPAIVRAMEQIGQAIVDMREAPDPRTTLEVVLVRLSAPELDDSRAALVERIERLERALAKGGGLSVGSGGPAAGPAGGPGAASGPSIGGALRPAPPMPGPAVRGGSAGGVPVAGAGPAGGVADGGAGPAGGVGDGGAGPAAGSAGVAGAGPAAGSAGVAGAGPAAGAARGGSAPPADRAGPGPSGRGGSTVPPAMPGPAGVAKSALGAHRPGRSAEVPGGGPVPEAGVGGAPGGPAVAAGQGVAGGPAAAPSGFPSREELTVAWGDKILPGLRAGVKVYVATGRFLSVGDGGAVYAVPDRGLLSRAEAGRAEVEAAISEHFGRRVPLRLVLDDASASNRPPVSGLAPPPPLDDDPTEYDLTELEDVPGAILSPEQRLLEAFPGAEEVPS